MARHEYVLEVTKAADEAQEAAEADRLTRLNRHHVEALIRSKGCLFVEAQTDSGRLAKGAQLVSLPCSFDDFVRLVAAAAVQMSGHQWDWNKSQSRPQTRQRCQPIAQEIYHKRLLVGQQASDVLGRMYDPYHNKENSDGME